MVARVSLIKERPAMFKWSLFVDIEGFSQMFLSGIVGKALGPLRDLTRDLFCGVKARI
jgi:hypothetical protein